MPNKELHNLILRYLNEEATSKEKEVLFSWLEDSNKRQKFKEYLSLNNRINNNSSDFPYEKALQKALRKIEKDKKVRKPVIRLNTLFKYAVAASVVLLFSLTYILNRDNASVTTNPIIVNNNIEPGTDKATLTLEDGSVVELDKEHAYQDQNVNSNGEQIVYKANDKKPTKIAYNYLTIPRGGEYHIILSDGTQVWLNSESQLKYPVNFIEGETRQVELVYGEAYFDVSSSTEHEGSKFKVFNRFQEVEVLGTEFNIKAYKDETNIYTTLVEGKVTIDNGVLKRKLTPNHQLNLNTLNDSMTIGIVNVEGEISWKKGIFSFKGKSLKDIMKVISRWYDVDVVFINKDLESLKFRGVLDKHQSIESILSIMKSSTINNYEIKNKTIILK